MNLINYITRYFYKTETQVKSPILELPEEIQLQIFQYLKPEDWLACSHVCKTWMRLASDNSLWNTLDLTRYFPNLTIIAPEHWKPISIHCMEPIRFNSLSPLDGSTKRNIYFKMAHLTRQKVEADRGITLIAIPEDFNLNLLKVIAEYPDQGESTSLAPIPFEKFRDLMGRRTEKSYWALLTNSVLVGSRGLNFNEQIEFLKARKLHHPGALELTALIILSFVLKTKPTKVHPLFSQLPNPLYSRTRELIDDTSLSIGAFGGRFTGPHFYLSNRPHPYTGCAAQITL